MSTSMMHSKRFLLTALVPLFLLSPACGTPSDDLGDSPDGESEAFGAVGGKADSVIAQCDPQALLDWVNQDATNEEALKNSGVHTRAARNIVDYKAGKDGALGTNDDRAIEDMDQLDAIPYVGPVALEQLAAGAEANNSCSLGADFDVIFSPQPSNATHLVRVAKLIDEAQYSLDIAMYSYSDNGIRDAIARAILRGVDVRMIFEKANEDKSSPEGTASARLEELGVDVRYVNKIMHHKFVIVDGPRDYASRAHTASIASGSANWSSSAGTRYDENTVFVTGSAELALRFQREFNLLWHHSRDFAVGEQTDPVMSTLEITDEIIPEDPDVGAVFTSSNFKTTVSSRYGNTFSRVRGLDTVSNYIVAQIGSATDSIKIASGHLRSRPVAEALIAKRESSPEVDIQVYLDGQEYISQYWAAKQQRDLDDCLVEAGDSQPKREDCIDKGFYFGLALHEAGIDVRYKYYSYRWHYRTAPQMHHKYIIIDSDTVIQGSYNLSDNAEHNTMENMATFSGANAKGLVAAYEANFDAMWVTGEQEGLYNDLISEIESAEDEIPIIFDAMALDWDQVTRLKDLIYDRCPAINSDEIRENPDRHYTCPL